MTVLAMESQFQEMRHYPLETRECSEAFETFLSNDLVRSIDIGIINYVLDKLNIEPHTNLENSYLELYLATLIQIEELNLKNVNMDYWAFYNFLK